MKRIGVVGIVVTGGDFKTVLEVQGLLSQFGEIIVGRMGVPDKKSGVNTISLIVKGSGEDISALTGKLGRLENVLVKSALTAAEVEE